MLSLKFILPVLGVLIVLLLGGLSFFTRHDVLKSPEQRVLFPCPDTPNCVFSNSSNPDSSIPPFSLIDNNPRQSWSKLVKAIEQAGGEILVDDGDYCHAVFTSTFFRFKDDLEIKLEDNLIAVRSASRAGKSDLGQNRKRVEKIRAIYTQP